MDKDEPHIELIPPHVPTAEELHEWGIMRRYKITREELERLYPSNPRSEDNA